MKYPKMEMFPKMPMYPAHMRHHQHYPEMDMNGAVRTVAGASVAIMGIGVMGAMVPGVIGAFKP